MAFLVAGKYIKLLLYSKRASIHVVKCTAVAYIYELAETNEPNLRNKSNQQACVER
jgi:hypothetical protein